MLNFLKSSAGPAIDTAKKSLLAKFVSYVGESVKTGSKVSSTRIQTYIMMVAVILSTASFVAIEITNAILAWVAQKPYAISSESLILFGMILSHHLGMMFSKPRSFDQADFDANVDKIEARVSAKLNGKTSEAKPAKTPAKPIAKAAEDSESDESANYI